MTPGLHRQKAERLGRWAEHGAEAILWLSGWQVLARRARTPLGEIDLIARKGQRLAFIEVKYRAQLDTALGAVSPAQTIRLIKAGAFWRAKRSAYSGLDVQYDLIALAPWRWPKRIEHAFSADHPATRDLI